VLDLARAMAKGPPLWFMAHNGPDKDELECRFKDFLNRS
jgi:hypothetical protein